MISLHNILSIARYERKTLFRSWFFRIFSILSLFMLFGINFGMVIEGGGSEGWAMRSIPGAIPYVNLLMLNVAQAIIAVFLASDFLKRDKKLDTTEVIYMRSMTNGEYVVGKTWGNLQVFLVLNIAVMVMALIFNLLGQGVQVSWESYILYLLLISIPTLVFIMGLSFLLMSVIRNQAITFVLVLGYIGITLFMLQAKYYYVFDYMAFNIPMLKSEIVGFGNLETILVHRGIYFMLGLSFIFLTIYLLKRLPQSEVMTHLSLILGILFLGGGGYLAYKHVDQFKQSEQLRSEMISLNNQYGKYPFVSVLKNSITLEHEGERLSALSEMHIKNNTTQPIEKLVFSLNTGFDITSLKINDTETSFERNKHLVIVSQVDVLNPADEAKVDIVYSGSVNEAQSYLDIDETERLKKHGSFIMNVDKRYGFVGQDYVLLTSELNWYPRAGVTYSTENVGWFQPDFTHFHLKVKTRQDLQAVSQGKITKTEAGEFVFDPEYPLPQISLAIGNYEYTGFEKDSIKYGIWYIKGHDFFKEQLPEIKDTIQDLVSEKLNDLERRYNLNYAFDRLNLVEVPAQFKSFERTWTTNQEMVQPEQVFIPEKAYLLRAADFEGNKKNMNRWGRGEENLTPEDMEIRLMNSFMASFTEEQRPDFSRSRGNLNVVQVGNPSFIFPMFYNFQNNIQSQKWPATNRIFEAYLKSKVSDNRLDWMRNISGISEDERANIALQDSTFEEILSDPKQKIIIDNVIKLKGDVLFSMVEWKTGKEEFEKFIREVLNEYRFQNMSFEEFDQRIHERFGISLIPVMNDWFKEKALPGYLISSVDAVKVRAGDMMKTKVSLKVTNFSEVEGLIKISFRLGEGGRRGRFGRGGGGGNDEMIEKLVYLEPHQTKEMTYLLNSDPRDVYINTLTSQNIPQLISSGFRNIEEDPKALVSEGVRVVENPVQMALPNEIIIDNEDPEFEITKAPNISLLEKWLIKESRSSQKYAGMNTWRPPSGWTATTSSDFYGAHIRSGYYIRSGDGSMKARWKVPIPQPGYYDLHYYFTGIRGGRGRDNEKKGEYHFIVHSDDGAEEQTLAIQNADNGWNHLGSFYFSQDTALVELSNESEADIVVADAVKLTEL